MNFHIAPVSCVAERMDVRAPRFSRAMIDARAVPHHPPVLTPQTAKDAKAQCRQVTAPAGADVYSAPCGWEGSPLASLQECERFDAIWESETACAGEDAWIKIRYTDEGGLLQYGHVLGSWSGSSAEIGPCPSSAQCPGALQDRQVVAGNGVGLWRQPCWPETAGETGANFITQVPQWGVFSYDGPYSKQTSLCADGHQDGLCWVKATYQGQDGWVPVGSVEQGGTFDDTLCHTESASATAFVRSYIGEWWAVCRFIPGGFVKVCQDL